MKVKCWITILILSLAINAAAFATVGYNYYCNIFLTPSHGCSFSPENQHLYHALDLSASQLARMDSLARTFHSKLERLGSDMHGKRGLLVDLLRQKAVDSEQIENLRKEMAGIQDEIQKEVITHIKDIKEILNHEQTDHFFNLLRTSMEREGSHWLAENRGK
jgi:Spy/CpxP family protein refolding chaperone